MDLNVLFLYHYDVQPHKRYLAYKHTAQMDHIQGYTSAPVGSFKVICKRCFERITNGQVVKTDEGWNFLVSCHCNPGKQKRFSATEKELRDNDLLAMAYLRWLKKTPLPDLRRRFQK